MKNKLSSSSRLRNLLKRILIFLMKAPLKKKKRVKKAPT
jgi:hypothetical protein